MAPIDNGERAQAPFEMPLSIGGDKARGLGSCVGLASVGVRPVSAEELAEEGNAVGGGRGGAGRAAGVAYGAPVGDGEGGVGSLCSAHGAVEAGGGPAGQREGAQGVGGTDERRVVAAAREGVEGSQEQQVLGVAAVVRVGGQALGGFDDDGCREVEVVVGGDRLAVLGDGGDLGEGVEAAPAVQLCVDDGEGFDAGAELGGRLAHALGHGPDLAVFGGEQRDDAIGFAQLVGAQDDRLVSVRLHHGVIVSRGDEAVVALGASRRAGRNSL